MNERISFIKNYHFFRNTNKSSILSILMDIKPIEISKNCVIYTEGYKVDNIYFVIKVHAP